VQIENADGSLVAKVAKVSDPVNTSAVKTTSELNVQAAAAVAVCRRSRRAAHGRDPAVHREHTGGG